MPMSLSILSLALLLAAGPTPAEEPSERLTLTGTVRSEAGMPLKGGTVFIHTAGPRQGTSSTCPSCYLDCRKKAETNARGEFRIEALDPRLRFNLLVIAPGHKARIISRVDPLAGSHSVALAPLDLAAVPRDRLIRGRVSMPNGRPAVGAVLEVKGVRRGNSTRFGGNPDVDPVAVTDANGEFALVTEEVVSEVLAKVDGVGFARRVVSLWAADAPMKVRMAAGVTVKGRILDRGKPVAGVSVGMASEERDSRTFVGNYEVTTDDDGRFVFRNMPARDDFFIYGKMESFGRRGLPEILLKTTGEDGSTLDVGDLPVAPVRVVAGRVVLKDGKPIPPGTRLGLGREGAWDLIEMVLEKDGRFRFEGVPSEQVSFSTRLRGYMFSYDNPNVDWRNDNIEGRVDRDIEDLTLLMEPGEHRHDSRTPPPGVDRKPGEKPLRSASWKGR